MEGTPSGSRPPLRVVTCSDTHGLHATGKLQLPQADLLVFAGDAGLDDDSEIQAFEAWLASAPVKARVVTFGNMDSAMAVGAGKGPRGHRPGYRQDPAAEKASETCLALKHGTVVCDSIIEVQGYRILGSPWTPAFYGQWQLQGEEAAREHWARVLPPDAKVDILITHGPPRGYGDMTKGRHVGDKALMEAVQAMEVPPLLWITGHIHESYGPHRVPHPRAPGGSILLINAAVAYSEAGKSDAAPRVVDLPEVKLHELSLEAAAGKRSALAAHDVWKAETDLVL